MQSYILVGNSQARDNYIQTYTATHSIPPYAVTKLEGTIKIADVHNLLHAMRIKVGVVEKRLIILSGSLTIPAQNALLKFLEELAESDTVLFDVDSKDMLLDTIISRCTVITLGLELHVKDLQQIDLSEYVQKSDLIIYAETIKTISDYENFMLSIRQKILNMVNENDDVSWYVNLLKDLHVKYQFVKENNVNPKFTLECANI